MEIADSILGSRILLDFAICAWESKTEFFKLDLKFYISEGLSSISSDLMWILAWLLSSAISFKNYPLWSLLFFTREIIYWGHLNYVYISSKLRRRVFSQISVPAIDQ